MTNFIKLAFALVCTFVSIGTASASLVVELGDAEVSLLPGGGTKNTLLSVVFKNPSTEPVPLAGYSLFFDIAPEELGLPAGVSFANTAATYWVGQGVEPLTGAANPGTINHAPAAGDLGLGQIQNFNGSIAPGASIEMVQVNLVVDLQKAIVGGYPVFLNDQGQNSLDAFTADGLSLLPQSFSVEPGVLSLVEVPEPSATTYFVLAGLLATSRNAVGRRAPL